MAQPYGGFPEDVLKLYAQMAAEKQGIDFSEGETYDFARCIRPDGSSYGTRGKCRKGTEAGPSEKPAAKAKSDMTPSERIKSQGKDYDRRQQVMKDKLAARAKAGAEADARDKARDKKMGLDKPGGLAKAMFGNESKKPKGGKKFTPEQRAAIAKRGAANAAKLKKDKPAQSPAKKADDAQRNVIDQAMQMVRDRAKAQGLQEIKPGGARPKTEGPKQGPRPAPKGGPLGDYKIPGANAGGNFRKAYND
jgi:hypothetical protein